MFTNKSIHYNTEWLFWPEENINSFDIIHPTYIITTVEELENLKLVVTNKGSSGSELPTVSNGTITNYTWKINEQIIKNGSGVENSFYTPTESDVNEIITCTVTATSTYDPTLTVSKVAYLQIIFSDS